MMLFAISGEPETEAKSQSSTDMPSEEERQLQEDYRRFGIEGEEEASMDSIADVLSTFMDEENPQKPEERAGRRSDISKKKRLIPILAICAAVGLLLYYAVLRPMLQTTTEEKIPPINTWLTEQMTSGVISELEYTDLLNKGKCEVLGNQNRILMFNHVPKANIQSIEVHNEYGTYTFYRDSSDNFVIKGAEETAYNRELFSSLVVSAGYTISMTRISENCENMSEYGLAPEDAPARYTLTTTNGVTHTVYIGKRIPTGAGYYCSYEDRPAVYVLDASLSSTLLADVRSLMTAMLTYPISQSNYYTVTNFDITKNGEHFLHVDYLTDAERVQYGVNSVWKMVFPEGGYTPSSSGYDAMLQSFASFVGNEVLEYNVLSLADSDESAELTDEQLATFEKYGLAKPAIMISFDYTVPNTELTITNRLWFSKMNDQGQYYVYSWLFDLISVVDAASYPWLSYDLIRFIDRPIFQMNINNVSRVEISGGEIGTDKMATDFRLVGDGQELVVTDALSGTVVDTHNFRQLYKTMLSLEIEDYTESTNTDEASCIAVLRVTTRADVVTEYRFYAYATRRCFFTVNGKGEFYVNRDMAAKMVEDAKRVLAGEIVDSDGRS